MLRIRTGYSFRQATGKLELVMERLKEIGAPYAPITDRASTFGFYRWYKLAKAAGLKPVFGVELAVVKNLGEKRPNADYWTFVAKGDELAPINRLVELATNQFYFQPLLTIDQALNWEGVNKITGHRPMLDWSDEAEVERWRKAGVIFPLAPSSIPGIMRRAIDGGFALAATSDNRYTCAEDDSFYETLVGRNADLQAYPQHILSEQEWKDACWGDEFVKAAALKKSAEIAAECNATPAKAHLPEPHRPATLEAMCREAAPGLGIDLSDPTYEARLKKELDLIKLKQFEDYFYIVADIVQWARDHMIVGPARGSSCGSLVCYLLKITTVDPIPHGLIFERFIDINRNDLPDIDIDFSDQQRHLVFKYISEKYGAERVARLGTVANFHPRSAMQECGMAMGIPKWKTDAVADVLIERSSGDSRALDTLLDTLKSTDAGKRLMEEHPEMDIATRFEGHPRHYCLAKGTKVKIGQTNHILKGEMAIEDLWEIFINSPSEDTARARRKGHPRMPVLVSMEEDTRLRPQKAINIWPSGIKECIRLRFEDGSEVECTPEHKFLINGDWLPCGLAKPGSLFRRRKPVEVKYPGKTFWKGKKRPDMANSGKYESGKGHPNFRDAISSHMRQQKKERQSLYCDDCRVAEWKDLHHNDHAHGSIDREDISFLCKSCHRKRHAGENNRWKNGIETDEVRLVSIEPIGERETFDIEMPTHHNFLLGNGILTSNSQHAAGVVVASQPITDFVAIDRRTGATMCDKKDAEDGYGLLKIDALGLTQLSIFEDALEMANLPRGFLETLPLDDQEAFNVLNKQQWAGIFQFNGLALQSLAKQVNINKFEDIVNITALARPGALTSGGATAWVNRKNTLEGRGNADTPVTYPHELFRPYLEETLGVVTYQEQVMNIGREVGDLSWEDVTALRKAMSKSLGKEFFDQFGDRWKAGAIKKGIPQGVLDKVWDDLCLSGDTVLINPFPSKGVHRTITLKQLYDRGGLGPTDKGTGARKRQSLLMWDGESLKPFENWGVSYSGKKITYRLTTESGNSIKATADHKFLMSDGSWKRLKEISLGDCVMSDAGPIPTARKEPKRTGSGGHNWWWKLKEGIPNYEEGKRWLRANFKNCEVCKQAPYEETHHVNMDHEDNRIENLMAVCRKCHKRLHAAHAGYPKAWEKGRGAFSDAVVSIEEFGEEDVYDVHMPAPHHNFLADGIIVHNCAYGAWGFNKSHSVAYGLISYWCCWLKAHFPFEFAAATLNHIDDPMKMISVLREMAAEGYDYVPVDAAKSVLKWSTLNVDGQRKLLGPLTIVKGLGPKTVNQILGARARGERMPARCEKLLKDPKTPIDSLYPIRDRINEIMPDPLERNIVTSPTRIIDITEDHAVDTTFLIIGVAKTINPRDENETIMVARRGYKLKSGPLTSLNLQMEDDSGVIYCKITRFKYEQFGTPIVKRGRPGKAIYAVKGTAMAGRRFLMVESVRYIGDMET